VKRLLEALLTYCWRQHSHFHHPTGSRDYLDTPAESQDFAERIEALRQQFWSDLGLSNMGAGCGESLHKGFFGRVLFINALSLLWGAAGSNYYYAIASFNCYLGDRYSFKYRRRQTKSLIDRLSRH